jgi:hypothetical protein
VSTVSSVKGETLKVEWTAEEKKDIPPLYGCEILLENTTIQTVKDPSFPTDAYIVRYEVKGKQYIDLCRGNRIRIFDLYYDKFGPNTIQRIEWGYGRVSPKLWGYKAPTKSKKRK